jgi:hypothetical protein
VEERREGDKGTKGVKETNKGVKGRRYERNHSPLNSNGLFLLVKIRSKE